MNITQTGLSSKTHLISVREVENENSPAEITAIACASVNGNVRTESGSDRIIPEARTELGIGCDHPGTAFTTFTARSLGIPKFADNQPLVFVLQ